VWAPNSKAVYGENVTDRYAKKQTAVVDRITVLIRVWKPGKKERLPVPVTVADRQDLNQVFQGESRGERADLNDILSFDLLKDHSYLLQIGSPVQLAKPLQTTDAKQQVVDIELTFGA